MRWGLLAFLLTVLALLAVPGVACAAYAVDEASAFAPCQAAADAYNTAHPTWTPHKECGFAGAASGPQPVTLATCSTGYAAGPYYLVQDAGGGNGSGAYHWCLPPPCSAGSQVDFGGDSAPSRATDGVGCCVTWDQPNGSYLYGDQLWNHYQGQRTGAYCAEHYSGGSPPPSGPPPSGDPPNQMCDSGKHSCYRPQDNTACYTTESGEQICTKLDQADNCASGATGSVCYGKDGAQPPPPSDPPIAKDQSPDNTVQGGQTDSDGNTSNFTQNNYSGTSPGGSGGSSGDTSGGKAGSGSNQNASGNSPGPDGDHGTDANGHCPDGSVPTASGCSGTYSDGGCDVPPQCFGDAVMCGSARELHEIKCKISNLASGSSSGSAFGMSDVAGALAGAGVPSDGGASGDPSTSGLVTDSDIGTDGFDSSGFGYSRTCPANPSFSVLGHSYTLDLVPFCNFAGMLGWFVLLVGSLAGLRVVATGR